MPSSKTTNPSILIRHLRTPSEKLHLWQISEHSAPSFFSRRSIPYHSFFEALSPDRDRMGLLAYQPSIRVPGTLGLTYVSTLPHCRQQGVAFNLLHAFFNYSSTTDIGIANTPYTPEFSATTQKIIQTLLPLFPKLHFYEHPKNT